MNAVAGIHDRGRGPEIVGTRITVLDVFPLWQEGWHPSSVALWFGLSTRQVQAAYAYIEQNREEVVAADQRVREWAARGNPPEVEARRAESRAKLAALRERLAKEQAEGTNGAGNPR